MRFEATSIPGVWILEPVVHTDARGFFFEGYRRDLFEAQGIRDHFVQDNTSGSRRGTLRGLHYQAAPRAQAKLVRVLRGSIYDVAVDIRPGSPTFGRYVEARLSGENRRMIYIPEGFAHGFLALEEGTEVAYKVSDTYSREHDRTIRWDDPKLGIAWPKLEAPYLISEKDARAPFLSEAVPAGDRSRGR